MSRSRVTLREAQPGDEFAIYGLVRELADYERLLDHFVGSPEDLAAHLFAPEPYARAVLAWVEGPDAPEVAGFALYFFNYSTFLCKPGLYLEDLYVRPALRRHGIGRALLAELARRAVAKGCGRMEWSVLDWNAPTIGFYKSLGATPMDEWTVFRLTGVPLSRLAST
ncbi:MAG: GNAT family N-acetyltransferase [Steroidobacteraceae bacterium]